MAAVAWPVFSIGLGALGGFLASLAGLPMPWLLGPLVINAIWVQAVPPATDDALQPPRFVVTAMICVIGVMIGGAFTPELAASIFGWWPSVLGVLIFTIAGQFGAYLIYRHVFAYDTPTAFFAASPGGFVENIAMGREAGADVLSLTLLQFLRLVTIIILLPLGFSIWSGQAVGSAAGESFGAGAAPAELRDYALMLLCAGGGYGLAILARIPMAMIIGPLVATAILHLTGHLSTQPHGFFMIAAQVVLGASLGARFAGLKIQDIVQALQAVAVVTLWFFVLVLALGAALASVTQIPLPDYVMSLAPAGVIEMSLVALSLGTNPVFVTTHHVIRILVTVLVIPQIFYRWLAGQ